MAAVPAARPAKTPATIAGGSARHSYTTSGDVTGRIIGMIALTPSQRLHFEDITTCVAGAHRGRAVIADLMPWLPLDREDPLSLS
jgi:hypothetical protein